MNETNEAASGRKSVSWVFWLLAAKVIFILLLAGGTIWIIYAVSAMHSGKGSVPIARVQGAGYTKDGKTLWLRTENRRVSYTKGRWHSEKADDLEKTSIILPFRTGVVQVDRTGAVQWKAQDQRTIIRRDTVTPSEGLWAAGYESEHVYHLFAQGSNLILRITRDSGRSWFQSRAGHVTGDVQVLAVSPDEPDKLAIGTTEGLYVSDDSGAHFTRFLAGRSVTSAAYSSGGTTTLYAAVSGKETSLFQLIPQQNKIIDLDMGTVESDRLVRILPNPRKYAELVIITHRGDLYRTENGGQNWTIIAKNGRGLNGE
ncbi:hypothetical protein M3N64_04225 [Sporolactobacillus sp. CPB3-1]|uniref:Photosynthesis system II assembly factor Ycf48/Hcf136-like domain-containing protein n=1 Tax=Sporolactobacillus mangiferae TaxID=2940498 RepID=A0ABT0M986_9BACL|nr:hypothetical protein [Sporolactobacillus mangiferae]MCL1631153.1 hypothetical protein [Sporolactobacillus mangiferae]